jgi:DNA-binding HxlR family transcriptional regulator
LNIKKKEITSRNVSVYRKLEEVVGCKWSVSVLLSINAGINRPGALEHHISGISKKVLSERLRKLTSYGLLEKCSFPEIPPRTEYSLTASGKKLMGIIEKIHTLDSELKKQHLE